MNLAFKETYRSGHNGADSKSVSRETGTGVRIPPSPLKFFPNSGKNFFVATLKKLAILYRENISILRGNNMKYIKQFAIIILISFLGEVLSRVLPFSIPASVYGLFLMLIALMTKVIKPAQVKDVSNFLMDVMPIMFVPSSVGIMVSWGLLKDILVPALIVSMLGTLLVMIASGKIVDLLVKLTGKAAVVADGQEGKADE